MKFVILTLILGAVVASASLAGAAVVDSGAEQTTIAKKKKHTKKAKAVKRVKSKGAVKAKSDLQTDVKFDDSVLHGQYQTPDEAMARVENEKGLNELLGVRKNFKDRLATAAETE